MALIIIAIQDVPGQGATVSVVNEPIIDLSAPDATEAQRLRQGCDHDRRHYAQRITALARQYVGRKNYGR